MRHRVPALLSAALLGVTGVVALPGAESALAVSGQGAVHSAKVCANAGAGSAACTAEVLDGANNKPLASTSYTSGYAPADLSSAYGFPLVTGSTWNWNGQTVAIVDAYQNPNVASDLAAYRAQFNLPPCTVANGCFTELNENGGAVTSSSPGGNTGWGQEIDLDVDMVSATCPDCKILLEAASSASFNDLGTAVNTAAARGANAISNSYGGNEFSGETTAASEYYNHPGIAITASSGDGGYGVEFPAASNDVVAVGGTSLSRASNSRGWSEKVWSTSTSEGAGSGCSGYIAQSSWQTAVLPATPSGAIGCTKRVVADVSSDADPYTGVAVYDSYGSSGGANWLVFGGTSVASPTIASFFALANAAGYNSGVSYPAQDLYQKASAPYLNDVTSGRNASGSYGANCPATGGSFGLFGRRSTSPNAPYLCDGQAGYDGPTGMGTPHGLNAF
ncbi:MAG TPA: peptidase S8 [Actinomycetota bacterium]|nr:peptidase S8 [Actinomycetota bacterium]